MFYSTRTHGGFSFTQNPFFKPIFTKPFFSIKPSCVGEVHFHAQINIPQNPIFFKFITPKSISLSIAIATLSVVPNALVIDPEETKPFDFAVHAQNFERNENLALSSAYLIRGDVFIGDIRHTETVVPARNNIYEYFGYAAVVTWLCDLKLEGTKSKAIVKCKSEVHFELERDLLQVL
ncbi:hypothetical protein TSUD_11810 [Trifolium subterraneum]|uniref:Uncharacterized protein n=1 Tax=Trifolium subterraneum TaxID=3900 RepID=A0A2Z6M5P7_TRISU|nr:hypothetical protein TSUD_11810 [Trifolium subterraneum]